jgi:ferredoxin
MSKVVRLNPIGQQISVETHSTLLSVLLHKDLDVLKECGGRGMCATCHIYIQSGMDGLTKMSRREQRTLEVITSCAVNSRLACQTRVIGTGVVVELPVGMYVSSIQDIEALIGRRAQENLLHPVTGQILVEKDKLVTRSTLKQLSGVKFELGAYFDNTQTI